MPTLWIRLLVFLCACRCMILLVCVWGADDKTESKGMVRIYKSIGKWIYLSNPSRNKKPMKRVQQKSTILEGIQSWTNKAWPIVCPTTRKPSFLFRNEFLLIFQLPLPYITEKQNHDILQCTTRSAHSSLQHTLWHIKREAFLAVLLSILCLLIRLKIQYNKYYKVFNVANWITIMVSIKYYMNWSWFLTDEAPVSIWQTRDSHQ